MSTSFSGTPERLQSGFELPLSSWLLGASTFLSAFLLFQVQPTAAKVLLPTFGGSAGVWSVCLVFFQSALFLGYLYAHLIATVSPLRRQFAIHIVVVAVAAAMAVYVPRYPWESGVAKNEAFSILYRLMVGIGVPYFLLATTGPLLQAWYARADPRGVPYRLYAVSNLASLFGLLCYPFLLEPLLTLRAQLLVWRGAFWMLAVLLSGSVAVLHFRRIPDAIPSPSRNTAAAASLSVKRRLIWLALPACSSAVLLAVTAQITEEIAPIPLLWIVPLAIYLGSFAICFDRAGWYDSELFRLLLVATLCFASFFVLVPVGVPSVALSIVLVLAGVAIVCMFCHGELYALRPPAALLTTFYLYVALGGAAGGLFVGIAAPNLFSKYSEIPLLIFSCGVLAFVITRREGSNTSRLWRVLLVVFGGLAVFNLLGGNRGALVSARNFYGVLKVVDVKDSPSGAVRALFHGKINHGTQFLEESKSRRPTAYYGPNSGAGKILSEPGGKPRRVGLLGLGAGVLAVYARPGDMFHFYEINPLVVRFAREYFTFLNNSPGKIEITTDDARLALEREPPQGFDVLVVDVFSGDAIPLHLLTIEAFEQYERHLKPDGVLAVHISNRYLDLAPVVARLSSSLNQTCIVVNDKAVPNMQLEDSTWALLLSDRETINSLLQSPEARLVTGTERELWTDDYVNLLSVIR